MQLLLVDNNSLFFKIIFNKYNYYYSSTKVLWLIMYFQNKKKNILLPTIKCMKLWIIPSFHLWNAYLDGFKLKILLLYSRNLFLIVLIPVCFQKKTVLAIVLATVKIYSINVVFSIENIFILSPNVFILSVHNWKRATQS